MYALITGRSTFGPHGNRCTITIFKGIHLFFHYIGLFANSTDEKFGFLKDGYLDLRKTVAMKYISGFLFHHLPKRYIVRQYVLKAF